MQVSKIYLRNVKLLDKKLNKINVIIISNKTSNGKTYIVYDGV